MSEANTATAVGEVTSTSQPTGETVTDATVVTENSTTSQPQGEKTDDKPKKEGGVGKRIRELVEERNAWREAALRSQGITKEQDRKEVSQGKPESSKFNSYEEYLEALADWKAEQKFSEREKKTKEESTNRERVERLQKAASTFEERSEKIREKYEDFDDVVYDENLPVTPAMSEAILDSDIGPEILYHLGTNPKEASRIARLSPFAAAREIGKIELKLSTPQPKKPSNAPDPINPVGGKEKVSTDMEKIPIGEWMKRRNEQVRGK